MVTTTRTWPAAEAFDASAALGSYYTSQPAPTQWVAVGTLAAPEDDPWSREFPRMVVGCGRSEEEAIGDLHRRVARLRW